MTNTTFHHDIFSEKFRILRASHRSNRVQASGEYTAFSGQFDHLPEIAPASEWPYGLDDDQSGLQDRSRVMAELKKQLRPDLDAIIR
ncbi:hypothetical protein [Agrobacterium salinitolerans]|uniref:hypothetical protein n=1 Tax=Agrobacterium salinitolerans TaxID=1183413 RepID=UPI0020B1F014|nr:hypothetical protein [Agrobacterium salinitolerans]